jgi:hypothetical protein
MLRFISKLLFACAFIGCIASGQTTIRLGVQSDGNLAAHASPKPIKTGSALPGTCQFGEFFLDTDAAIQDRLWYCSATDTWTRAATCPTVQQGGSTVGSDCQIDFAFGTGLVAVIGSSGGEISVSVDIDTAVMLTKEAGRAAVHLAFNPTSGSGSTYTGCMTPPLGAYAAGTIILFKPDVANVGAANANICSLGNRAIKTADGADPAASALAAGQAYLLWDNGTHLRVIAGLAAATGDVTGPASSTSGNVATFTGTTGKLLQDSGKALPSGSVVGTTDTQALSNKTLASPTFTALTLLQRTGAGDGAGEYWTMGVRNAANSDSLLMGVASSAYQPTGTLEWVANSQPFLYTTVFGLRVGTGTAADNYVALTGNQVSATSVEIRATAGDISSVPTAGIWYNSSTSKLRCAEGGVAKDCISAGGGTSYLSPAAYSSRPAANTVVAGTRFHVTNLPGVYYVSDGSNWVGPWYQDQLFVSPPAASTFTSLNGEGTTPTLTDTAGVLVFDWTSAAGVGYAWRAVPAGDYSVTAALEPNGWHGSSLNCGIGIGRVDTGASKTLGIYMDGRIAAVRGTAINAGITAVTVARPIEGNSIKSMPVWVRYRLASGNRYFEASYDGITFFLLATEVSTASFVETHFGFSCHGASSVNVGPIKMVVYQFSVVE